MSPEISGSVAPEPHLSKRELEVLILIADGLTTKEIAHRLGISFKTTVSHRSNMMRKLSVHNVVEAVRYAIRVGWIKA